MSPAESKDLENGEPCGKVLSGWRALPPTVVSSIKNVLDMCFCQFPTTVLFFSLYLETMSNPRALKKIYIYSRSFMLFDSLLRAGICLESACVDGNACGWCGVSGT